MISSVVKLTGCPPKQRRMASKAMHTANASGWLTWRRLSGCFDMARPDFFEVFDNDLVDAVLAKNIDGFELAVQR